MMANPRDTRCISAAFDFLNATEFCPKCIHGYDSSEDGNVDATDTTDLPKLKKSGSIDSALLGCQQLNLKNAEKLRVCLCGYQGDAPQKQPNGDILGQKENSGDTQQECETGSVSLSKNCEAILGDGKILGVLKEEGEILPQCSFDSGKVGPSTEDSEAVLVVNGIGENGEALRPVPKSDTVKGHSLDLAPGVNGCDSIISNYNRGEVGSLLNLAGKGENSCTIENKSAGTCEPTRSCANGHGGLVSDGQVDHSLSLDACSHEGKGGAEEEEEVVMRPNRKSLHRSSTDTGIISTAFSFLPVTDSVFLPAVDPAPEAEATTVMGIQTTLDTNENTGDCSGKNGVSGCADDLKSGADCAEGSVCIGSEDEHQEPKPCPGISSSTPQASNKMSKMSPRHSQSCLPTLREDVEGRNSRGSHQGADQSRSHAAENKPSTSENDGISEVRLRRSRLSKDVSVTEEDGSGDSSDEDAGVYAESFRRSNWIRIDDDGQLELAFPAIKTSRLSSGSKSSGASRSSCLSADTTDGGRTPSPRATTDESLAFSEKCPSPLLHPYHKRSDSTSSTLSEHEFKKGYIHRRKFLIQRQNSSKEYHRYSAKLYDEEKSVVLEKGPEEMDFGLHILDSQPAYITKVATGSPAERAGVEEGQILIAINGANVLTLTHDEIVTLITNSPSVIHLGVATTEFQPSRDLQASIIEGHMHKLGGSSTMIMRRWKKRYFILRQDNCLYYYKDKSETDPLGAIPLAGYTFSRHLDSGRDFCFKAEKYGARTYYFMTDNRDTMTEWVGTLSEAAARSKKRKESFVSVSSHNVGLPALEVRRPECTGYLLKVGNRRKTWQRHYCILKDACLYYYKNMNSLSALGVAHLHGYKVDPSISVGKKHAFGVVPPDDTLRAFQFSAENDTDRQRWVDAMIRSIQRWVQIDNDC